MLKSTSDSQRHNHRKLTCRLQNPRNHGWSTSWKRPTKRTSKGRRRQSEHGVTLHRPSKTWSSANPSVQAVYAETPITTNWIDQFKTQGIEVVPVYSHPYYPVAFLVSKNSHTLLDKIGRRTSRADLRRNNRATQSKMECVLNKRDQYWTFGNNSSSSWKEYH